MSIGPRISVGICKSETEVKAELDADRSEARSPERRRMFDDMPECLNDLEELLYLVRANDFPTILGNRRYWLYQAMHEVQRLRNLSSEKVRLKTQAPETLNGRSEREKYEYANEMLERFIKEDKDRVIVPDYRLAFRSWWLLAAGVWCAVLTFTTFDHYWLYQLSRWVVCAVAIHGALKFETSWKWVLWTLAVLFNPIVPFHFGRNAWQVVDGLAAVSLFISSFLKK
jgi:hypothetical protein